MVRTCCQVLRKRWKEIRVIHKKYRLFYWLLAGTTVVALLLWVGSMLFHDDEVPSYEMNLFTELVGVIVSIGFTVLVVDQINERREAERRKEQAQREQEKEMEELKVKLVRDAASRVNQTAVNAIEELRHKGWLEGDDGLLRNADLIEANLATADLRGANLQDTKLVTAKLQEANLFQANLSGSKLYGANMYMAQLQGADLSNANLRSADLRNARMRYFHIQEMEATGLDLLNETPQRANLNGADLEGAFLEGATLPDEENLVDVMRWPDGEQYSGAGLLEKLKKFTDVNHPEFEATLEKVRREREYQRYFGEPVTFSDPEAE